MDCCDISKMFYFVFVSALWEDCIKIVDAYRVHCGCILGALWVHCGCILDAFWVHCGC